MSKEKATPHLDKWLRTFKNVGKGAGKIVGGVLDSAAPGISTTARSIVDASREAQSAYNESKNKVKEQLTTLNRTLTGKNAQSILNDAYNDIKNGTFSLDKISDTSYDSIDDYDSYIDNISIDASDPNSVALGESKKNMAILGRTVAEGNVATIEGMKNMTATLSNIQIKTSQASVTKIANIVLTGTNQISTQLAGVNGRLDVINQNIISILDFQRNNAAITNQATMEYYSQSSQMMHEMGAIISEMKDFMDNQKSMKTKTDDSFDDNLYDMSGGFSFENYKKLVKNNYKNSTIGTSLSMLGMVGSMGGMTSSMGLSPLDMILSFGGEYLLPKNTRKSIKRLDKVFTSSIDEVLYRMGENEMKYDTTSILKPIIGSLLSLLGKERKSFSKADLGNFKKDYMGWNGVAQKTLVEVIPSYLARIESSLTKNDERYYNMDTGMFMSRNDIKNKYQKNYQSIVESEMSGFTEDLDKALKKANVSEEVANSIYKVLNRITDEQITDNSKAKELNKELYNTLRGNVGSNELRDLMMSFTENIDAVKKSLSEFNKSIEEDIGGSIYRNLFNEGQTEKSIHKAANLNSGIKYNRFGKSVDDMTEEEIRQMEADEALDKKMKDLKDSFFDRIFKSRDKKKRKPNFDQRMASHIDNMTNSMYDKVYEYGKDNTSGSYSTGTSHVNSAASSAYSQKVITNPIKSRLGLPMFDERQNDNLNKVQSRIMQENLNDILDANESDVSSDIAIVNGLMTNAKADDESSLKALVLGLYTNFLKPMASNIFGKNGIFKKVTENKFVKKIKHSLFDEKDGIFGGVTSYIKDQIDYLKYVFTGKGYTNRAGKTFEDDENSVFGHLSRGYDFVFKNTMKYIFGKEYESNETFQKYFSWLDFKGKKERNKQEQEASTVDSIVTDESKSSKVKSTNSTRNEILALPDKSSQSTALVVSNNNIVKASEEAATEIIESANTLSTNVLGTEEGLEEVQKKSVESISSKFKKNLPKTLTAGVVGGAVGASTMIHGAGLLGSLFLPGGPITGAMVGMGLSIMSRSKKFQEFVFGKEDKDGNKTGGLISNKMQNFVKKNLPLIVGAGAVGAVTGMIKSTMGIGVGGSGASGFLLNTLLPGGPIGGAVLGLSVALLKNNEKFNKILFGEKANEEGSERTGGMFSKGFNTVHKIFEKSGNFIKGGLKGIGIGTLAGATISKMGILGASVTMGGPIGWGLAGLGLGIASQSKKFQDLLFGTQEFDENGNLKGRAGDGLLTRVRNMLVINVFEPLHDKIQQNVEDFGFWLKRNLTYPFRLAFGPILDSLKTIKTDISDAVHETFNNIADTVGKALKKGVEGLFKPFTSLIKVAGKGLINTLTTSAKMALMPVSVPLKLLSWTTRNARRKAKGLETRSVIEHFGDILTGVRNNWETEDVENADKYKGIGGRINRFLTHGRDIIQGIDAAKLGYEQGLGDGGQNSLNWMNVGREKAADKVDISNLKKNRKQWKEIDKYRRQIIHENKYADLGYNAEENEKIRNKLYKMGIDKDWIASDDDLNLFFKSKTDWANKFDPTKNTEVADLAKNGIKLNETGEQAQARRNTAEYQKAVLNRFDTIVKEFTKLGAKAAINKKKKEKLNLSSVKEIDQNLKDQGLTWDDIGIDPADLVDKGKLSEEAWDDFLREKFKNGEVTNEKNEFSKTIRNQLDREENLRNILREENDKILFNEADIRDVNYVKDAFNKTGFSYDFNSFGDLIKWLDGNISTPLKNKIAKDDEVDKEQTKIFSEINESTAASAVMDANNAMSDGASSSDVQKSTGKKYSGRLSSIARSIRGAFTKQKKDEAEKEKDEYLRGSLSLQDGKLVTDNSAIIDGLEEDEKSKKKGTVFDTVKEGFKGLLGSLFGWVLHPTTWKVVGLGLGITGLYGGKIKEFFDPILAKVGTFIEEKGLPFLGKVFTNVTDFVSEKLPSLIEKFTANVIDNMGPIIESAANIMWSAITTTGKSLVNKLARFLGWEEPFEINGVTSNNGKTFDSYEEAVQANNGQTENIHQNSNGTATIMDNDIDIDDNGNAYIVGNSSLKSTLMREGVQLVRSKKNRKMAKFTTKVLSKGIGWASGMIPGLKVGKAVIKGGVTASKGVYNTGKAVVNIAKNAKKKGAEEVTEAVVENTLRKKGAWKLIKDANGEYLTSTGKKISAKTAKTRLVNGNAYIDDIAKGATKVAKEGAEATLEANATKKGIKSFLEKASKNIKKAASWVSDKIPIKNFNKFVDNLINNLAKKLKNSSNSMLQKVGEKIASKTAEATGKTVASATVIIGAGFAVWDAINGALNASYLFGVNEDKVTAGMRLVSSIMEVLLGTGPGAWIDILLEVYGMISGDNPKQWFARWLWKALPNTDASYLDDAITEMELETEKYNRANGTQLTVKEYNEKKNSSNSILGRISKGWTKLTNKEKYDKKYNYSAYEVTDAELAEYKNKKKSSIKSSKVTSQKDINNYDGSDLYNGVGYGRKYRTRALGYGTLQSDSRWADYSLGKFPDGSESTMTTGGCGPTALSMIANSFGNSASPLAVAQYAKEHGYIKDGGATSDLFTSGARDIGLQPNELNQTNIKTALSNGEPIVLAGRSYNSDSIYTKAGHVVMAQGISNGYVNVNDPMRGNKVVKLSDITTGMTHGWSYSKAVGYGYGVTDGQMYKLTEDVLYESPYSYLTDGEYTAQILGTSMYDKSKNSVKSKEKLLQEKAIKDADGNGTAHKSSSGATHGGGGVKWSKDASVRNAVGTKPNGTITSDPNEIGSVAWMERAGVRNVVGTKPNGTITLNNYMKNSSKANITSTKLMQQNKAVRWRNRSEILMFIKKGYKTSSSKGYQWNIPSFYNGLSVAELKMLTSVNQQLIYDENIPLFGLVYKEYVSSGSYKAKYKLTTLQVTHLLNANEDVKKAIDDKNKGILDSVDDNSIEGMFSKIISGVFNVGKNLITALVTGKPYQSIYDTMKEETEEESTDSAIIDEPETTDDKESSVGGSSTHKSSSGATHGGGGGRGDYNKYKSQSSKPGSTQWLKDASVRNAVGTKPNGTVTSDPNEIGSVAWMERASARNSTNIPQSYKYAPVSGTPVPSLGTAIGNSIKYIVKPKKSNNKVYSSKVNALKQRKAASTNKGGVSRDIPIGYGFEDTITSKLNDIKAISYANQAQLLGKDYETAKQEYYTALANANNTSDSESVNGTNANFATTEDPNGSEKYVPPGYGKVHTYMGWQCITSPTSDQMKLRKAAESYDSEGFGKVGDRYAVAMKRYYGVVGDYLNITQTDGTMYKVALADIKGTENGSEGIAKYVHGDGSMVEFVVDKQSWYAKSKGGNADKMHANPGTSYFHPELGVDIAKIEYVGNYWKNDANKQNETYNGLGSIKKFLSPLRKSRALGYGGNWLQIIQAVKVALAERKLGYSQKRYITLNVLGQTLNNVRTDCSGYVSACLRLYGSLSGNTSSRGLCSLTSLKGFTKGTWQGWEALQPGDIISRSGHVEIFVKNENGKHHVYTCGGDSSCNNPGTNTDNGTYTTVWRPNEVGSFGVVNTNSATNTNNTVSSYSATSPLDGFFSSFSNAAKDVLGFGSGSSRTPAGWFAKTLNGEITSTYGQRNDVFGNEFHRGIDIASEKGTSVRSPIDGVVVSSGTDVAGYGNYAVVRSADGNNHLFAHLNKPVGFGVGSEISKNDIIGEVGSTGKSTGDHLHYEIRRDGNKYSTINPMDYKYDRDISKHLNITNQNSTSNEAVGGGSKDFSSTELANKLNVALNTDNVEDKLDTLIEVMRTWAERDAKASKATQNNTNITTNNVVYGSGKDKKKTNTTKRTTTKELTSKNLSAIHDAIAAKA